MLTHNREAMSEIFGISAKIETVRNGERFAVDSLATGKLHETYRSRAVDGSELPNVILPAAGDVEDFFATVATYYQDQSPISALAYVLGGDTANLFSWQSESLQMRFASTDRMFRTACIGAAIGEAVLAGLTARDSRGPVAYSACRRTLAFVLCRATLLFESETQAEWLAERWATLRKLTGLSVSVPASEAVLIVHEVASECIQSSHASVLDNPLREALRRLATEGDHDGELLVPTIIDLYPETSRHFSEMRGAFDGRMTAFTRVVGAIQGSSRGRRIDEIAVAAACNRILPGSFMHAGVLEKLVDFYPAALIWYGFFSVLSGASLSKQPSPGLIAKLERDLLEEFSFERRPRCDISLEELEVLARAQLRAETIRPSQQRALLVSLLPGVDVYTRFGTENEIVSERPQQKVETDELHERLAALLEEALVTLKKAGRGTAPTVQKRRPRKRG